MTNPRRSSVRRLVLWSGLGVGLLSALLIVLGLYINRKWDGKLRFTVVDVQNMQVLTMDMRTKTGWRLNLPGDLLIQSVNGKGDWKVKVLPKLATKYGNNWAANSIADYLGIAMIAEKSQLGWWDRMQWSRLSNKVSWEDDVIMEQTNWVVKKEDIDGAVVYELSTRWEQKAKELFRDSNFTGENVVVKIINTVSEPGMGTHTARFIENAGLKVSMIETNTDNLDQCVIESSKKDSKGLAVKWLNNLLGCSLKENMDLDGEIIVKLGRTYRDWWKGYSGGVVGESDSSS